MDQDRLNRLNNLYGLNKVQNAVNDARQDAIANAPGTPSINQAITFVDGSGNQIGNTSYIQRIPGKYATYDVANPNFSTVSPNSQTVVGGRLFKDAYGTDYNSETGEIVFKAPKAITETPQWQDFVNSANTALRNQPLEQAINYIDTDEFKQAYDEAKNNAETALYQRASLEDSLGGQNISYEGATYFGASSTLSDGSGKVRTGAYLYIPVVQPDGSTVYEKKSADEALKLKNVANMVPGFIRNTQEYIDSTAGEYAATGAGIGQNVGRVAGAALTPGGPVAKAGGAAVGDIAFSTLFAVVGYLLGDDDGHTEKRYSEVLDMVNKKGDTSIMDLSQDEKSELYAMVTEAAGRMQNWSDKGIELPDEMKQYYANLVGLQYSLEELGFNKRSNVTNVKDWVENFTRQTANNTFGGTQFFGLVGGVRNALGGESFGEGYSDVVGNMTSSGTDTYESPAAQLLAPRSKEGVIGDRGWLGVVADIGIGLITDPAGKTAQAVNTLQNAGKLGKVGGAALNLGASIVDDGGISILASSAKAGAKAVGGKAFNWANSRLSNGAQTTTSGAAAAGNSVAKDAVRIIADEAGAQVDNNLDNIVGKAANSLSEEGDDAVRMSIRESLSEAEQQLAGDIEHVGKNLSMADLERAAGQNATNGLNISAELITGANRVFNSALDNLAKGITGAYDIFARRGNTDKLAELMSSIGAKASKGADKDALIRQYRGAITSGVLKGAIKQVARQIPLNALVSLGNTAIEMETNRSMGRDFDSEDFANSFLSNFGIAMLSAAAPAGMRAGSQVLDAMTGGGVRKMREKANQYALKLANIPADAARNAPVIKEIRSRLQKFAGPDARRTTEQRYLVNKARAEGIIGYDRWVYYQNLLSNAEMGTETQRLVIDAGAKELFDADRTVMQMLGGVSPRGRIRRRNYDQTRQLVDDFIIFDNLSNRVGPQTAETRSLSEKAKAKREDTHASYLKQRDDALKEMDAIIEENGGDVDAFHRALFGSKLDAEIDTSNGPVRADVNDTSLRGRLRHFYDVRSQLMADNGITKQSALDSLRSNPAYAGVYIRFAYSEGDSVETIAENVAQFYTVSNKPKTSQIVQSIKNELGLNSKLKPAGPVETAVKSLVDVSDVVLTNKRNNIAVEISKAFGDSDLSFLKLSADPEVTENDEANIKSYKDFEATATAKMQDIMGYDPNADQRQRTDRDSANLNEMHTWLTNSEYIQQQSQATGISAEQLARSYMADHRSQLVDAYRKIETNARGAEKAKPLATQYRKKIDAWLSGEDLSQQDVRQRREFKAEMAKQRNSMSKLSDDALIRMGNNIKATPVQQAMARQELARRRSVNHGTRQVSVPVAKEGDTTQYLDKLAKEKFEADAQNRERTNQQLGRTQIPESSDTQTSLADAPVQQRSNRSTQLLRPAEELGQQTDALGYTYTEAEVPVADLIAGRSRAFQPRVTASGEGTRRSVRERGYQEGMVDQPLVVWKDGDAYKVLGGHSRTMGLEDRAKAGLDNPENVRARVYTDITEAQAKQISRRANQGGQYESDLDMAKSIAESQRAGEEPQVQKNNMVRYTTYDDYAFAWDAIEHDAVMQQVINSSETFNTKAFITGAKKARKLGLTAQEYMRTVKSLYANDRLTATNVDIVARQVTTRRKNKAAKEAQGMLFDDDLGVAVDSLDILNEHAALSRQLKSQQNALKKVTKIGGMSESFVNEANSAIDTIKAKMDDIDNELIRRYNARQQARNVADGKATARIAEDGRSIEVTTRGTEDDAEPETYLVSMDQASLFGGTIADDAAMRSFNGTPQDFVDQTAEATKDQLETQVDSNQGSLFAEQDVPQPSRQETTEQQTEPEAAEPEAAEPETAEPTTAKEWYDAFVREHDAPPTIDDYRARVQDELDGTAPAALTNVMDYLMYNQINLAEQQRGIIPDAYIQQHARALHLGRSYNAETVKQVMSYVPENAIKLAENKVKAPTLAQCKSAALYTGQLGSKELSPDVIRGLEALAEKQDVSSQRRAMNSFMADDSAADVDGLFYSKLSDENKKTFMSNLEARAKNAVSSVNETFEIPDGLKGQARAAFLGKQLHRARLAQEILNNPEKYSKKEYRIARDDDGKPIPGSGKYLTSPERLVVKSIPTDKFGNFKKYTSGVYKTQDQRNSKFNSQDEVYVGTGQVLAASDVDSWKKIVRSMKRINSDPELQKQVRTLESRVNNITNNSLDDLPLVQELLNSVYGVDAVRFTGEGGDNVLLFEGKQTQQGGIWEERTTFDQIDAQTLHDYDATADLWKENVKSKQSDTKARLREERASEKEALRHPNFVVYNGGRRYVYEITNPRIAEVFQTVSLSTSKTATSVVGNMFRRFASVFRHGTTGSLNPAYLASNYVRDIQTASITAGLDTVIPRFSDDLYASIFEAAGIPTADADQIAQRLRAGYGSSVYNLSNQQSILRHSPAEQRRILYKTARQITGNKHAGKRDMTFESFLELTDKPSDMVESRRRQAVANSYYNKYIREHLPDYLADGTPEARKQLVDNAVEYATFYARNATTDFSYRPQYAADFLSFIPYARTALASGRSFARMFLADPVGMISRITAYGIIPYLANLISNMSDEDKAATYASIPEWERSSNWIICNSDGSYIKIPYPQELEVFLSPARILVENHNDIKNSGIISGIGGGMANFSPVDFSGFFERDINGDIDWVKSFSRLGNSLLPQAVSPIVESILNRDLYTGSPLHPTVDDLVRQGAKLNKDGTVDPSALTFASRNSKVLGLIADATGLAQGDVYNLVTGYTGTFGRYLINAADRIMGAPQDAIGGQDTADYAAQTFFNTNATGAQSSWNDGMSDLYDRKDTLMEVMDSDNYTDAEKDEYIRDYVDSVKRFCDAYSDYYAVAGGMTDKQRNQVVGLLNFYKGSGSLDSTNEALNDASYDEYNAALQRAVDIGVMPAGGLQSNLYGSMNDEGEVTYTTPAMRAFQNRVFGTPEQAKSELTAVLDEDDNGTMKELRSAVYDALDPYYDRIAAGEQLTDEDYDEMDAIRKAYMGEFYRRIDPIIEKYGATILNNDDIIEALNNYTITTSDDWQESVPQYSKKGKEYHRYISSKLFPNATADVQQILLEHYGMGGRDTSKLKTDERATQLIQSLQQATAAGEMGKAQDYQRILFAGIQNGTMYVSDRDMNMLQL